MTRSSLRRSAGGGGFERRRLRLNRDLLRHASDRQCEIRLPDFVRRNGDAFLFGRRETLFLNLNRVWPRTQTQHAIGARRRRHRIARAHDCQFVYMRTIPGYRSWFETPSKGEPFDSETRHAVIAALELAEGGAR